MSDESPRPAALFLSFLRLGATAFGGPAMVAHIGELAARRRSAAFVGLRAACVRARAWLDARTFMDGIALGQVTPGPLVVTATFVGHQLAGLGGALVSTVAIFFPSFAIVVAAAPWFGRLRARPWFALALHGAMLSFVGLLTFVTTQFAAAVVWSPAAIALAIAAFVALRIRVDVLWVVLGSGAGGVLL